MIRLICAVTAACVLSSAADARTRANAISPECKITMPCIGVGQGAGVGQASSRRNTFRREQPAEEFGSPTARQATRAPTAGVSVSGLVGPLASKLASIEAACPGTHAISGIRHTRIAGTRRMSLHAQGKAVDVRGPYGCIYAQLKGWSGGYSTDAGRVQHVHISYDDGAGREMGLRFAHGGGRRHWFRNSYARMR